MPTYFVAYEYDSNADNDKVVAELEQRFQSAYWPSFRGSCFLVSSSPVSLAQIFQSIFPGRGCLITQLEADKFCEVPGKSNAGGCFYTEALERLI